MEKHSKKTSLFFPDLEELTIVQYWRFLWHFLPNARVTLGGVKVSTTPSTPPEMQCTAKAEEQLSQMWAEPKCKHNRRGSQLVSALAPPLFSRISRSSRLHGLAGAGGAGKCKDNVHGAGLGNTSGCSGVSLGAIPAGWPLVLNFTSDRSPGRLHTPCLGMSAKIQPLYMGNQVTTSAIPGPLL